MSMLAMVVKGSCQAMQADHQAAHDGMQTGRTKAGAFASSKRPSIGMLLQHQVHICFALWPYRSFTCAFVGMPMPSLLACIFQVHGHAYELSASKTFTSHVGAWLYSLILTFHLLEDCSWAVLHLIKQASWLSFLYHWFPGFVSR